MSVHSLEAPLCASSGSLLLSQGTLRKTLSLPLVKALLAMGRPRSEKTLWLLHSTASHNPVPSGSELLWSEAKVPPFPHHLLQGRGTAPLDKEVRHRALQRGSEGTYPQGLY